MFSVLMGGFLLLVCKLKRSKRDLSGHVGMEDDTESRRWERTRWIVSPIVTKTLAAGWQGTTESQTKASDAFDFIHMTKCIVVLFSRPRSSYLKRWFPWTF